MTAGTANRKAACIVLRAREFCGAELCMRVQRIYYRQSGQAGLEVSLIGYVTEEFA